MLLWLSAHCKTNTLTSFGNRYILNCIIPATISLNSTTIVGKTIFSSGSSFFASGFLVKSKSFQYRQICYDYLFINTISGSSSTRFSVRVLYLVFSHFYSSIRPHLIMGEWINFRFLVWQKSIQGAILGLIRSPICSITNFGPLFSI